MSTPRAFAFKPTQVIVTLFIRYLKLRRSRKPAKVIDHFVYHYSYQPGPFRASSFVSLIRTHRRQQSFLQQIFSSRCVAHTHQRVPIKVIAMSVQPTSWIEREFNVRTGYH
jgi:hypothetical protein